MATRILLGQNLKSAGLINERQLMGMLAHQRKWGGRIGKAAVELGFVREDQIVKAVGFQIGVRVLHIGENTISPAVLSLLPERIIRTRRALPLFLTCRNPPRLVVAFSAPDNLTVVDEVRFALGRRIEPVLVGDRDLEQAINRHFPVEAPQDSGPWPLFADARSLRTAGARDGARPCASQISCTRIRIVGILAWLARKADVLGP